MWMRVSWRATCSLIQCIRRSSSTCSRKSGRICTLSSSGVVLKVGRGVPEALSCVIFSLRRPVFTPNGRWCEASARAFLGYLDCPLLCHPLQCRHFHREGKACTFMKFKHIPHTDLYPSVICLGHSMHSFYTRAHQPYQYGDYTLFVAEVASTLNEGLMTEYLLKTTTDRALRLAILNHSLEELRGTLFRQTMFAEFEQRIHALAEKGEPLTADSLSVTYRALNEKYYGAEVTIDDLIDIEWARIPHFYYNFYVFQYATGISAASALVQQILHEGKPAVERYLKFLRSGSSVYSIELLRKAGVDMTSPEPVRQALSLFESHLAQMEELI